MILPTTSPRASSSRRGAAASASVVIFLGAMCFFAVSLTRSSPGPVATETSLEENGGRRLDESVPVTTSSKEAATSDAAPGGLMTGGSKLALGGAPGTGSPVLPCSDMSTRCAEWAAKGECGRNSLFMHKQCASSCGTCEALAANGGAQPVAVDGQAERCRSWAASGECKRNPRYMQEKCQDSCPKNLYGDREV